jgi:hypothetical protein
MHQIKYLWPGITAVSQTCCFMPKAFEKCGLYPINQEKALERIPSVFQSHTVARHLDNALLEKLEGHRFGEWKKKPRGQKVPAGQSNTKDQDNETTQDSTSEEEKDQEEKEIEITTDEEIEITTDEEKEDMLDEELPDLDQGRRASGSSVVAIYKGKWPLAKVVEDQSHSWWLCEVVQHGHQEVKQLHLAVQA